MKEQIAARLRDAVADAAAAAQTMRTLQHDLLCTGHCGHLYLADGVKFSESIAEARQCAEETKHHLVTAQVIWGRGKPDERA